MAKNTTKAQYAIECLEGMCFGYFLITDWQVSSLTTQDNNSLRRLTWEGDHVMMSKDKSYSKSILNLTN